MQHRLTIDYGDDVLFSSGLTRGAFDGQPTRREAVRPTGKPGKPVGRQKTPWMARKPAGKL
jgi:hypothetical protein